MKHLLNSIVLIFLFSNLKSQTAPYSQILLNVFKITTDTGSGTCFAAKYNDRVYFFTAGHLFKSAVKSGDVVPVTINSKNVDRKLAAKIFFHQNRNIDIALIEIKENIHSDYLTDIRIENHLGQSVLFFGFPLSWKAGTPTPYGYMPIVKGGIISGFINYKGSDLMALDGNNIPGFSGGPVLCKGKSDKDPYVCGIISGYFPEINETLVYDSTSQNYKKTSSILSMENSGVCFSIESKYMVELINSINK